jgi:tetratricopeptide (TPR) repeat protein
MKSANAETWSRVGETALLALVFLTPLAAHVRTYDPAALKLALFESCALVLGAAWVMKGLARGRWEAAAASRSALFPMLALAAWTLARFAALPFKSAAIPDLAPALAAWLIYAIALLEFGGARPASRLAFWTAAAASLLGAAGAARRFAVFPSLSAPLADPDQLAAFAAAALPVVLSLRLDPESSAARRLLSASTAVVLAFLAAWSGSSRGLAAFVLSAFVFALAAAAVLRGPAARRGAILALACAALAAVVAAASGPLALGVPPTGVFAGTGSVGTLLLAWTMLAASAAGLRAAWNLRRRGAPAEAGYAASFSAAFGAWGLAGALGLTPSFGAGAWLSWAAAGMAAGMVPLARPRGAALALPLPFGEDVRRLLQYPAFMLFACALAWPGGWLASDVRYNRALAEARSGSLDAALADAGRVWPGSAVYPSSLYLRGRALMDQGKPREALDAYARLDDAAPDFSRVHARRAEAYATISDWPSSARERRRQADLTPLDLANLTAWAEAARAAGDIESARLAAARAQALAPEETSVRTQLAAGKRHDHRGLALRTTKPKPR